MFRFQLELVPFGLGRPERVAHGTITNKRGNAKIADYEAVVFPVDEKGNELPTQTFEIEDFDRERGAMALLGEVMLRLDRKPPIEAAAKDSEQD